MEDFMPTTQTAATEAAILGRLVRPDRDDLSLELAQAILAFDYDEQDRKRMHELAVKNQEGQLTKDEEEELDGYRRVAYFVDLMRSKARLSLKRHGR
jgi:hypothetical protein